MPYTIDPLSIQFTETRHGVNATARILFDGKKVGTVDAILNKRIEPTGDRNRRAWF